MTPLTHPSRRSMLAGAFGLSALGLATTTDAADAALGDPVIPTAASTSFFLSVAGIPGSSLQAGFTGQVEVLTWAWGVDLPSAVGSGGGSGVGKPVPRPFLVAADTDIHSPKLALAAHTGKRLASVLLSWVRTGEEQFTYLTVGFQEVTVTAYGVTPRAEDGRPYDVFSLGYRRVTETYYPQKPDGSLGDPVRMSFDYAKNVGS